MKEHTVYFELYGKKMKVTVKAESLAQAKEQVKNSIKFYDDVKAAPEQKKPDTFQDIFTMFKNYNISEFFGAKKT